MVQDLSGQKYEAKLEKLKNPNLKQKGQNVRIRSGKLCLTQNKFDA